MIKTRSKIQAPEDWLSDNDWDSHKEALWFALKNTTGDVVELGSGFGSTPFLKLYCAENNREFVTYETNEEWAEKSGSIFTDTYFKELGKIDLLFVDAAPGEIRKELIHFYKDAANVIVVHDVECGAEYVYGMGAILSSFKNRLNYEPAGKPHTAIVSNNINVCEWL